MKVKTTSKEERTSVMVWLSRILGVVVLVAAMGCKEVTHVQNIYPQGAGPEGAAPSATSTETSSPAIGGQGTINGGGGKGILCTDENGEETLEVLDLYEAKHLYKLELIEVPNDMDQAMDYLASLIAEHLVTSLNSAEEQREYIREQVIDKLLSKVRYVDGGLSVTQDSFEPMVPSNCKLVQLAIYYDESVLMINQSLWDQLDTLNKVGLLAHEILYWAERLETGAANSITARKATGHLLSVQGFRSIADGIPADRTQTVECNIRYSGGYFGYATVFESKREYIWSEEPIAGVEFVFSSLAGSSPLFRNSAWMHNSEMTMEEFLTTRFTDELDLEVDTYDYPRKSILIELENGQGTLRIRDKGTGEISREYELSCYAAAN